MTATGAFDITFFDRSDKAGDQLRVDSGHYDTVWFTAGCKAGEFQIAQLNRAQVAKLHELLTAWLGQQPEEGAAPLWREDA